MNVLFFFLIRYIYPEFISFFEYFLKINEDYVVNIKSGKISSINIFQSNVIFHQMIRKKSDGRFWEIDFLRGIAIILMVGFHFIYDLNHIRIIYYKLWEGPFDYASKIVASVFFVLVGISLTIRYNRVKNKDSAENIRSQFFIRGIKLIGLGLIITIISWLIIPDRFVIFGVLHCIGVSIILAIPFINKKMITIFLGGIIIIIGIYLKFITIDVNWFIPLGFVPPKFFSIDFFPLFPWFGIVLIGISLGHYLYPNGNRRIRLPINDQKKYIKNICFLGRHSLYIYFLHQPILFAVIFFILQPLL